MAVWKLEERMKEVLAVKDKIKSYGQDEANFCLVPFTTIILEPDGQVGMCRHKGNNFPIGNIKDNTIAEIWNGPVAQKWRREFLQGEPVMCQTETKHRHCQHCPENNKLLPFVEFSEIQTRPILKFTANFNGKCNLQCQMCDIWQLPNGLYNDINFWGPAKKDIFPFIKEMDMLSGEPFIQKDTYRLIDEVSEVNSECQWIFTTNMHWKLTDSIKTSLDKIFVKNIIMSVDSLIPFVYAKIRRPGRLDFVLENIHQMVLYNNTRRERGLSDIRFLLNFLVQKDNWSEIAEAIRYCEKNGIVPLITFCYQPSEFSLLSFLEEKRVEILEHYIREYSQENIIQAIKVVTPLIESLSPMNKGYILLSLKEKLKGYSVGMTG